MPEMMEFRAWDKIKKRMTRVVAISGRGDILLWNGRENRTWDFIHGNRARSIKVMQYTGLKDYHKKQIFVGDIVFFKRSKGLRWLDDTEIIENMWEIRDHCWKRGVDYCDIKVIGNIYENPELVE